MTKETPKIDLLMEISWEVCNKIGGIYTVLSTKARTLHKLYGDSVIFIGPDVWSENNPSPYFTPSRTLLKQWLKDLSLPTGVTVRVGRWNVPGKPITVLVGFDGMYALKDKFYGEMWSKYHVDSLHAYGDYDEACAFGHAAGIVAESLYRHLTPDSKNVIAHFDEWTTGMGLLYLRDKAPQIATMFTTHATSIGRSICGNGKPLYDYLKGYNGDQMAGELNMEAKHSLEKTAAHNADCFTTVSEITAIECEQLLALRPQVVTPNGFEKDFVPSKALLESQRTSSRKSLLQVARALTGRQVADDAFIVVTSGRCEYRNKGIDVFIDAMCDLRDREIDREIVAYIMVPAWSDVARPELVDALSSGAMNGLPEPAITHRLHNDGQDMILNRLRQTGFASASNRAKVSVIYVPCYLNGNDGVFNKPYYELLSGMDASVFASYYEPWGYTPLESIAFGVPTITTSLSGFGQWILSVAENCFDDCGVNVIGRNDGNYNEVCREIANSVRYLCEVSDVEKKAISKKASATSSKAAWTYFVEYYLEAYETAFERRDNRIGKHN